MGGGDQARGIALVVAGVLAITPDGLLVRLVTVDEWTLLFWRGLLSGLAIGAGLAVVHRRRLLAHCRAAGRAGLAIGLVFPVGNVAFILAFTHTTIANTLFIASTAPVFSALVSALVLREHVPARTWAAIACALAGIAVIASGSDGTGRESVLGDASALVAALAMGVTFTIARQARASSMVPAMALGGLVNAALVLPLATPLAVAGLDVLWLGLIGLVVLPLGMTLVTLGPRYLPAAEVGLLMLLEAVLSPLLVWAVLGETPGPRALAGGALVLATLVAVNAMALREGAVDAAGHRRMR